MQHVSIRAEGQGLVQAVIHLETEISRVEEGQMMRLIQIKAVAINPAGARTEIGRLCAWQGLYRDLAARLVDAEADAGEIEDEFDEISYDAGRAVQEMFSGRGQLDPEIGASIFRDRPASIVYVEQVFTHPAARGAGLALRMLGELRALLAGAASVALLKAVPIETPYDGPSDDFRRGGLAADRAGRDALVRYYRSEPTLGLRPPHAACTRNLLAAIWPAMPESDLFEMRLALPSGTWEENL